MADDFFTGPADEIIVIGGLILFGLLGIERADEALDTINDALPGRQTEPYAETDDVEEPKPIVEVRTDGDTANPGGMGPDPDDDPISETAKETIKTIREMGKAPKGQRGGQLFENNKDILPKRDVNDNSIRYRKWDVNPKRPGIDRDSERIVTGSDGSMYYTPDHYKNLHPMSGDCPSLVNRVIGTSVSEELTVGSRRRYTAEFKS